MAISYIILLATGFCSAAAFYEMINPATVEDERSLETTLYTNDRSTGAYDESNVSSRLSYSTLSKWKSGTSNGIELFLRLYDQRKRWEKYGKITVLCGECIMLAPVKLWWWMTEIFVLATVVLFAYEFFFINWVILVPAVIIAILEWMAFYKTCLKDPGILPRPPFVDAIRNLMSVLANLDGGPGNPGTARIVVHPNGNQETLHYCWRCHHFRGITTFHCGICDCCMIQHDHHCPVFGGCVAKNNLSSFHTMIVTMGLFWAYLFGYCVYNVITREKHLASNDSITSNSSTDSILPLTFDLIMAEAVAVIVIPGIANCIAAMSCIRNRRGVQDDSIDVTQLKERVQQILKFARENNFSLQEKLQLKELLLAESTTGSRNNSQDLNHNNFSDEAEAKATV